MSCCGCLAQPARITNILRDDDLLVKFCDLTGINVQTTTFMCDPCIELLDISAGFKERCLDIFHKTFPEAIEIPANDEMILFEEFDEESMEGQQMEHSEGDPFQDSVEDEQMTFFTEEIEPAMSSSSPAPTIRAPSQDQPSTSRKKTGSPKAKVTRQSAAAADKNSSSDGDQSKRSKNRMSYTSSKKLEAVKFAEQVGNRKAAKAFFIDESCIRKWRSKKTELLEIDKERCTKRKPNLHWPELDKILRLWVQEQLNQGIEVKPSMIKAKSIEFANSLDYDDFKGTSSYVFKFMQRYRIPGSKSSKNAGLKE